MKQNQANSTIDAFIQRLAAHPCGLEFTGLESSAEAYFVSRLYQKTHHPVVVIVPTPKDAAEMISDLNFFFEGRKLPIYYFPPYNILPFKTVSYHGETVARRISTLYQLIVGDTDPLLITTIGALMQKIVPKDEICGYAELILVDEEIDREMLIRKLFFGGYGRTTLVEEPGDFSVRGGILDVFSPLYEHPLRIEFLGDLVESIRFFSADNQRTLKKISEAVILPARETIVNPDDIDAVVSRIRTRASIQDIGVSKIRDLVAGIKHEKAFKGIESLLPLIYPKLDTLFDYLPDGSIFVQMNTSDLTKTALELAEQAEKNYHEAWEAQRLCVESTDLYITWSEVKQILSRKQTVTHLPFSEAPVDHGDLSTLSPFRFTIGDSTDLGMRIHQSADKENLLQPLADWIDTQSRAGYLTLLICGTLSQAKRLRSLLGSYHIRPEIIDEFPQDDSESVPKGSGRVSICLGQISSGFVWPCENLAIVTEDEIFGTKHRRRIKPRAVSKDRLLTFEDLKQGDLIVHDDHGIGCYEGLVKLTLDGSTSDFLLISYQDEDKLYLPVDRMEIIHKYMGVDEIVPGLDKLGGKSWAKVKAKVKRSAEKIAGELLKIYAARKVVEGFAFGETDRVFEGFEDGFSYEETEDQLKAIESVLQDMQKPVPMDRLICGDVGYGKTEVALRASFLAVSSGKQVAVLVPTTVLAEQHYETFSSRFARYPITVACLSRFRSKKEQRNILHELKTGQIDIIIGTHRLLQKDVALKDLGLLIVDEEQRFGVTHKEKLKKLKSKVDVLALTATPIPRTLYLSLMGVRDISTISTPPEYRKAILTYISEFDDAVISSAIRQELKRNGQIFFVHNHIQSIWRIATHLQKLVPEVRMGVAHGRLDENELEHVMLQFLHKDIDMLVCTTIIESGIDISSANTILINRADTFGLAQIYQLRGRVGRSEEQAYAYLFIPDESMLGKDAQKRLKVLMEYSDLGSGFQIAMSDLRIRGGGTILGASQSGHIASVGYDLFLKLMETAISELKGEPVVESLEPEINLPMSAFIPESYIPEIDQRLSAYRRLAKTTELDDIRRFKSELMDRFGELPKEVHNLLSKIMIRVLSKKAAVKRLDVKGQWLSVVFSENHMTHTGGVANLIHTDPENYALSPNHVLSVRLQSRGIKSILTESKNILIKIAHHVNF